MSYLAPLNINKKVGTFMHNRAKGLFAGELEKGLKNPAQYAAKMMVVSLVSKDLINCGLYTYQSYYNKRIPEEKRKFVAALDAMNGVINVVGQVGAFLCIERLFTPKMETKYTGWYKDPKTHIETYKNSDAVLSNDNLHKIVQKTIVAKEAELFDKGVNIANAKKHVKELGEEIIKKIGQGSSKQKDLVKGLGIIISVLTTAAFIKRVVSPLIATPLAGWYKEKYMCKDKTIIHDRTYYEWKSINARIKNDNKIDKSAFGQFATR